MKTCNRCQENIDSNQLVCPYCGDELPVSVSETNTISRDVFSANDKPIIVLKGKTVLIWALLSLTVLTTYVCISVLILPSIRFSDYGSPFFYMGWICLFCQLYFLRSLNSKKICFYNDRVEVTPYLLSDLIIYYNKMRVNVHGNFRVTISKTYNTSFSSPISLFRDNFLETFGFSLRSFYLYDHKQINEVMTILKKNASEYNIKPLS